MLRTNRMSGFTLIELMVVIVIIGVLASLAIPRFTEASAKAKVAEAPRVLASYESAMLAAVAELPASKLATLDSSELIFEIPASKWFEYTWEGTTVTDENGGKSQIGTAGSCKAVTQSRMGSFALSDWIQSKYRGYKEAGTDEDGNTTSAEKDGFDHLSNNVPAATKMIPNFGAVSGS